MATKVLILANKNSAAFIAELAKKCWENFSDKDGRKSKKKNGDGYINNSYDSFSLRIIDNFDDYSNFDFKEELKTGGDKHETFDKLFIFITPELYWNSDFIDQGYEYALKIINDKLVKENSVIQFRFLSVVPFEIIFQKSRPHIRRFVEALPHFDLISEEDKILTDLYAEYSPTHYNLIKKLTISDTGYINYLLHELKSVMSSSSPSEKKDRDVLNGISGLGYIDAGISLNAITDSYTFQTRVSVLNKCSELLNNLLIRIDSNYTQQSSKIPYKVFVVEDDPMYRKTLKDLLEPYFTTVDLFVPQKGEYFTKALNNRLAKDAANYNLIFLDLLYKNDNGNWYAESGLDLYRKIKNINNFCVTPIITSLPRAIVSSLIKDVDEVGIPYHLLLSKANGEDFLKLDFKDKLPDIISTCRENEKKKRMFKPFPSEGIFKGLSVPSIMLKLITEQKTTFDEIVNTATNFFNEYKNGTLNINTKEWNKGELPSPKMVDKITEAYLIEKLPSILTHRLIVIDNALKSEKNEINISDYEKDVLTKIGKTANLDKGYLTTRLGFSASFNRDSCVLEFKNIFLHEREYIDNNVNEKNYSKSLNDYSEVKEWFISILMDLSTYENWNELNLFNPYLNPSSIDSSGNILMSNIRNNFTIKDLTDFLKAFRTNFSNKYTQIIIQTAVNKYTINENKAKIPEGLKYYIDQMFELFLSIEEEN